MAAVPLSSGESEFERAWACAGARTQLLAKRSSRYDREHSMFYFPRYFEDQRFAPVALPKLQDDWIAESFLKLVLGQAGRPNYGPRPAQLPVDNPDARMNPIDDGVLMGRYLGAWEELVYSEGVIDGIAAEGSTTEKIVAILSNDIFGNRQNQRFITTQDLKQSVTAAEEDGLPIQFVLPAFPFKDQNPFRAGRAPASHVDAGDVALLVRLHALALAIWQVYPFGAEWIVLSDGVAYSPIFQIQPKEAEVYKTCLREFRSRLNLERTVHIVDLQEATERLGKCRVAGSRDWFTFEESMTAVEDVLQRLVRTRQDVKERFAIFARGMRWNIELRSSLEHYSEAVLWRALTAATRPGKAGPLRTLYDEVRGRAEAAAYRYAAHMLTTRLTNVYGNLFPQAVRATVHAKSRQVVVPTLGRGTTLPWNGVGVLTEESGCKSIESQPLHAILRRGTVRSRFTVSGTAPFAYQV